MSSPHNNNWSSHGRLQRGAEGPCPPRIFIHGTNIVDRDLILVVLLLVFFCYFSVIFSVAPSNPGRGLIVLFSAFFCYFLVFFSLAPTGKFSADALGSSCLFFKA